MSLDEKFMASAYQEALIAKKKGDVPVGCVIVKDGKIIAKAHNQRESQQNVLGHAEIIALNKACRKLKRWILDDCEIYVTIEPCAMCAGAIMQSRMKALTYGIDQTSTDIIHLFSGYARKTPVVKKGIMADAIRALMQDFFKKLREKNKSLGI